MAAAVESLLTVGAGVAWEALAGVASCQLLHARAPIKAGVISTCHSNDLAVLPIEALRTGAGVVVLQVLHGETNIYLLDWHMTGKQDGWMDGLING